MHSETHDRARLTLDANGATVVAHVVHREETRFHVAQPLPFLRLRSGLVDADGRRGRLADVRLEVDGDTPQLVLEVVYDDAKIGGVQSTRPPRRDATVPFERVSPVPAAPRMVVVSSRPPAPRVSWLAAVLAWLRASLAPA